MAKMSLEQGRWLAAEITIRAAADLAEQPQALRALINDWLLDADEFDKWDAAKLLAKELRLLATATRNRTERLLEEGQMREIEG